MKKIGQIVNFDKQLCIYEILSKSKKKYTLFPDELCGEEVDMGDQLIFDDIISKKFGFCAINPRKKTNKILKVIETIFASNARINATVIQKKKGGYIVDYKGFYCFLSCYESDFFQRPYNEVDIEINGSFDFDILYIKGSYVALSRWEPLKEKYQSLFLEEIEQLHEEESFLGIIKDTNGFGVYVKKKYSYGFVPMSEIVEYHNHDLPIAQKRIISKIIKEVFKKGLAILVTVQTVSVSSYTLRLNKNIAPNNLFYEQIKARLEEEDGP